MKNLLWLMLLLVSPLVAHAQTKEEALQKMDEITKHCQQLNKDKRLDSIRGKVPLLQEQVTDDMLQINRKPNAKEKAALLIYKENWTACNKAYINLFSVETDRNDHDAGFPYGDQEWFSEINKLTTGDITFSEYNSWYRSQSEKVKKEGERLLQEANKQTLLVCTVDKPEMVAGKEFQVTFKEAQNKLWESDASPENISISQTEIRYTFKNQSGGVTNVLINRMTGSFTLFSDAGASAFGHCQEATNRKF